MNDRDEKPVPSPCVSVCLLDHDDICQGCYRSAREIREWLLLDNSERREVLTRAVTRRRQHNPFM